MKIYKTQEEVDKDIEDNKLIVDDSATFECSIIIDASLKIAGDIKAGNIKAGDINAWDIKAGDIKAGDIKAGNINAWDIKAGDIKAGNIKAGDIKAGNIKAKNILYWAFCCVYSSIRCISIKGTRKKCAKPLVIDGEIIIEK